MIINRSYCPGAQGRKRYRKLVNRSYCPGPREERPDQHTNDRNTQNKKHIRDKKKNITKRMKAQCNRYRISDAQRREIDYIVREIKQKEGTRHRNQQRGCGEHRSAKFNQKQRKNKMLETDHHQIEYRRSFNREARSQNAPYIKAFTIAQQRR